MKIYDCFMYFDEEVVLDLRLNTLNKFVDYFVIVESKFTHKGDKRELCAGSVAMVFEKSKVLAIVDRTSMFTTFCICDFDYK